MLFWCQEAIILPPFVALAVRPRPGVWEFVRVNINELTVEQLTVSEYLGFKEELVDGRLVIFPYCEFIFLSVVTNYSFSNFFSFLFDILGLLIDMYLSSTSNHSMLIFLVPPGHHPLGTACNSSTATSLQCCSVIKTVWSHYWISLKHIHIRGM